MITLDISYRQLAVFVADIQSPYNNWSIESFNQGFAYREESVSFDTIEDGKFQVYINEEKSINREELIRKIVVPLKTQNGFELGSLTSTIRIEISPGNYRIEYSLYKGNIICVKIRKGEVEPEILVMNDKELIRKEDLFLQEAQA